MGESLVVSDAVTLREAASNHQDTGQVRRLAAGWIVPAAIRFKRQGNVSGLYGLPCSRPVDPAQRRIRRGPRVKTDVHRVPPRLVAGQPKGDLDGAQRNDDRPQHEGELREQLRSCSHRRYDTTLRSGVTFSASR